MLPGTAMSHSSENVGLLAPQDTESTEKDLRRPNRYGFSRVLIGVLAASLIANTVQLWAWLHERAIVASCTTPLTGSRPDKLVNIAEKTAWGDTSNITALDERWYTIDINAGIIQLPKESRLGSTQDFPWDETKGLYILNSYHSLHCLDGGPREYTMDHVAHCLDSLRSNVMCEADDSLLPYEVENPTEPPPKRTCRSWDRLEEFAVRNSACFQRFKDSDPLHNTLFEYMDCPPSSPYYTLVEEVKSKSNN